MKLVKLYSSSTFESLQREINEDCAKIGYEIIDVKHTPLMTPSGNVYHYIIVIVKKTLQ